MNIFAES